MGTIEDRVPPQERQRGLVLAAAHVLDQAARLDGGPRLRDVIGALSTKTAELVTDFDSLRGGPMCANCGEAIDHQRLSQDPASTKEMWVHVTGNGGRVLCFPAAEDDRIATPKE